MKVLLLGKSGLLGSYFYDRFSGLVGFSFYAPTHQDLDITDYDALKDYIFRIKPEVVLNCTGYTAVDDAETHRDEAFKLNGEAVGELARICKEAASVLIHFSTDYVFDGENASGYKEDDGVAPINIYGESKLEGERLIAKNMDQYYIIRTSWLFGEFGKNFVDTMVDLAKIKDELQIVGDQLGSPTYASDLTTLVIESFIKKHDLPFGIYHVTNSGSCSWCEYAKEIFKIKGAEVKVEEVDSSAFPRPAKRPHYSILLSVKFEHKMRPWQEALEAYLTIAKKHL